VFLNGIFWSFIFSFPVSVDQTDLHIINSSLVAWVSIGLLHDSNHRRPNSFTNYHIEIKPLILETFINYLFNSKYSGYGVTNISFHDREKMVASLIASGASAGAVTDPSSQNPSGETAASIAASHGHKGLAGYLSEVHLTSHLSSLTLTGSQISEGSSELEAELTACSVSKENLGASEDQVSLKASLDAVRNAAQAAARIQDAFRAHSFRKRKEREAAAACLDGYCIDPGCDNISLLSAMSKLSSRSLGDYNLAALSIQKRYRGWKGRKEFLELRQKVVKIQVTVNSCYYSFTILIPRILHVCRYWHCKSIDTL